MGTQSFIDPELIENLDNLESYLVDYEAGLSRGKDDTSNVQYIFRYAHNLKSSLGMLGFTEASGLLHKIESCFDLVRNAKKRATGDLIKTALLGLDAVRTSLSPGSNTFPDTKSLLDVLVSFASGTDENQDMSVNLPFPLRLDRARMAAQAVRDGKNLWLVEKLITTNIDESFFGMLPCFEQANALGDLLDFRPHWADLPRDKPECVLKLLIASPSDYETVSKLVHDSFRPVRPIKPQKVYLQVGLHGDTAAFLDRIGFSSTSTFPNTGPAIVVFGIANPELVSQPVRRIDGVVSIAAGDFSLSIEKRLTCLDAGADSVVATQYELEREVLWAESFLYTGLGGAYDR